MSYKTSLIILNVSNVVQNGYNSFLEASFPGSSVNLKWAEVALGSLSLYNSSFNINSALYANNTFSVKLPYSGGYSTINFSLPNGYYSYSDINNYIQLQLIAAGAYLVTASGSYWYPLQVSANSALYACQIDFALCYNSATGIPSGWSYPSSGLWTAAGTLTGLRSKGSSEITEYILLRHALECMNLFSSPFHTIIRSFGSANRVLEYINPGFD